MSNIITLDIETFAGSKPSLDCIKAPANYKKEEAIQKYRVENLDAAWRKQAVIPHKAELICLCFAIDDKEPIQLVGSEKEIITSFSETIKAQHGSGYEMVIVGHNIKKFDLPIIYLKACKYDVDFLKRWLPKKRYSERVFDTMIEFLGNSDERYISMDYCCKYFGLKGKGSIDGSMVHDMYLDGKINEIADYCADDIEINRKLYYKLA